MIEQLALILFLGLAAYRVTRFFTRDSLIGMQDPGDPEAKPEPREPTSQMAVRLDVWAFNDDASDKSWLRTKVYDLLTCDWCLGFHFSWVVYALFTWSMPWTAADPQAWVLSAFAIAGVQGFIASRMNA